MDGARRFEIIAAELASRTAPLLADRVAKLIAERYGEAPPLLTPAQAARFLQVDESTVRRLARRGELPVIRIGTGPKARLRFDPERLRQLGGNGAERDGVCVDVTKKGSSSGDGVRVYSDELHPEQPRRN